MGYGRRKYGRLNKEIKPVIDPYSIPTYVCGHCGKVKSTANPFVELTGLQGGQLFIHAKICGDCSKLLQEWNKK